ncbi:MAG: hypothetical protein GC151_01760 [Betaproteobacteria bacterium]|nr:hypothetical protein [Betaproteobacteria bacterium]
MKSGEGQAGGGQARERGSRVARWWLTLVVLLCAYVGCGIGTAAAGAIVTPNVRFTDGVRTVDIAWLAPGANVVDSDLAVIRDNLSLQSLFAMAPAFDEVNAYFVDAIRFCPDEEYQRLAGQILGCAPQPGNVVVLDSGAAAGMLGVLVIEHELGHAMNLGHVPGQNTNLMNPLIQSGVLNAGQWNAILASPLLIRDPADQNHFSISVRPIAVLAVPEPGTLVLVAGVVLLARFPRAGRRRSRGTGASRDAGDAPVRQLLP